MRTADFDYNLPPERIAQTPAEPRDSARLLVLDRASGAIAHRRFSGLGEFLVPGDLLVVNDTRVMAARLRGERSDTGGAVEALLLRATGERRWLAMFRPGRQAQRGRRFGFEVAGEHLEAEVLGRNGEQVELLFDQEFDPAEAGESPLPPYIRGYTGPAERYQTVYAAGEAKSAASPTAGLHFTPELLARLEAAGIERATISLDIGPGTFKPVSSDNPREHEMHSERLVVPDEAATAIRRAREEGRRVIAAGTTVVRTLEHVWRERGGIEAYEGWTDLMLVPGEPFGVVDGLITNFHLPRSTLLMLVCAFGGREASLAAYAEAIREGYRFYSFGDAMLVV